MNAILANPLAALNGKVDAASLLTDEVNRELYRHDVYSAGPPPLAVFRPTSVEELARGIGRRPEDVGRRRGDRLAMRIGQILVMRLVDGPGGPAVNVHV